VSFQGYVSFRFYKLCPCYYHSTRSTDCFNTIKSSWTEIIFALNFSYFFIMWLYISFIRLVPRQILTRMVQHSMHTSQSWFCLYLPILRPNWLVLGTSLSSLHFPIWTNYNKLEKLKKNKEKRGKGMGEGGRWLKWHHHTPRGSRDHEVVSLILPNG